MTFDQLEILEMIVEKGSFKAAAEALHRTQPTLSVAIKKLEEEFDLLLFNREAYRPVLTEAGEVFYKRAQQSLKAFRELSVIGRELGTQKVEPQLSIVIDPLTRFPSLEGIFSECLVTGLPTELTLRSEVLEGGLDLLLENEADFAIAPEFHAHPDIESFAFDSIELVPCVRKSLLTKNASLDKLLKSLTQIVVRTPNLRSEIKESSRLGVREEGRKCYVTDHGMKRALIREGFGWGRLARHEVEDEALRKKLLLIEESGYPSYSIELKLMRNRQKPMGPVARSVWNRLKEGNHL